MTIFIDGNEIPVTEEETALAAISGRKREANRMSNTCSATTKRGTRCRAAVVIGSQFCAMHGEPGRASELGRRGGQRNRHYVETANSSIAPPSTPEEIKNLLAQAMADVCAGKMHPRVAHTLTYIAGPLLQAMADTDLQHKLERAEALLANNDEQDDEEEGGVEQRDDVVNGPLTPGSEASLD